MKEIKITSKQAEVFIKKIQEIVCRKNNAKINYIKKEA